MGGGKAALKHEDLRSSSSSGRQWDNLYEGAVGSDAIYGPKPDRGRAQFAGHQKPSTFSADPTVQVMEVDVNGDGTIDFDEFKDMMKSQGDDKDPAAELLEAFKLFDKDKDGFISMRELKKVANMLGNSLSKEEVAEFLMEAECHDTVRIYKKAEGARYDARCNEAHVADPH